MTTITLEVPDELAARINALRDRLPALLCSVLELPPAAKTSPALRAAATHPVYREMMDFLATSPTPQQLIDFKISAAAQERLKELLDKNREEELTQDERTALETYLQFSHFMTRLKARAHNGQPFLS